MGSESWTAGASEGAAPVGTGSLTEKAKFLIAGNSSHVARACKIAEHIRTSILSHS